MVGNLPRARRRGGDRRAAGNHALARGSGRDRCGQRLRGKHEINVTSVVTRARDSARGGASRRCECWKFTANRNQRRRQPSRRRRGRAPVPIWIAKPNQRRPGSPSIAPARAGRGRRGRGRGRDVTLSGGGGGFRRCTSPQWFADHGLTDDPRWHQAPNEGCLYALWNPSLNFSGSAGDGKAKKT